MLPAVGSAQSELSVQQSVPLAEFEQLRSEISELRRQVDSQSAPPTDLLAPPVDPQQIIRTGEFRGAFLIPGTDVSLRIGGYARGDVFYDTGYVATGIQLFPSAIALDGTPFAGSRGQTTITGSQSRLNFDAQSTTEIGRLRGFVEMDFLQDNVSPRLRHAFGEWQHIDTTLIAGRTWTTFMDPAALPFVVAETTAVGAVFRRQGMFRIEHERSELTTVSFAIENPTSNDYTLPQPATDQPFGRLPDLIGSIRFADSDIGSLQIASMVRCIGFEDNVGQETLKAGWGLAVTSRVNVGEQDNIRMGVTGGSGIGSYLAGLGTDLSAAGPVVDGYRTLDAIGAYGAYQHFWCDELFSNAYYGFSHVESTPLMPPKAGKVTENAGVNLIWSPRPTFGVGVEYTYGLREVQDGTSGANHRIQFTVQFGP
jgi:hypothetical protein